MDYLNPKKDNQQRIQIMLGYILTAVAITLASIVILYQAYGFGLGKNGIVIQSSLTFFSSKPNPANLYLNDKLYKSATNTRTALTEGTYKVRLERTGYKPWLRTVQIDGGKVQHFDYPFLVPKKLISKKVDSYPASLSLSTQSLDRRWLLTNDGVSGITFKILDIKTKPLKAAEALALPSSLLADGGTSSQWQLVEWADDNTHVVLKHTYEAGKTEYILVDRTKPDQSVNLTKTLNITTADLTLKNRKYDQYFLFDSVAKTLQTATLKDPVKPVLEHVLAFKSYSDDTILYATDNGKAQSDTQIKLLVGKNMYQIKTVKAGPTYLLDLTTYSNHLYLAIGVSNRSRVYIYKDPVEQLATSPKLAIAPIQVLHIDQPTRLSFSSSAQFIAAENSQHFAVYDIENKKGYNYETIQPLDAPQIYATWMDGNRLTYTSGNKQLIFDYDYTNQQVLAASSGAYLPMFAQNYSSTFTISSSTTTPATLDLIQTPLLIPTDQ